MGSRPLKGDEAELILQGGGLESAATGLLRRGERAGAGGPGWRQELVLNPAGGRGQGGARLPRRASTATATKTPALGKALERRFGGSRLRLGAGYDAAGSRRAVPGRGDRGHLPGQSLPQLPRPAVACAPSRTTPAFRGVAVFAATVARAQNA